MIKDNFRLPGSIKALFALFALASLFIFAEAIYGQWNAPTPEFRISSDNTSIVDYVMPGSETELAGLQAGDTIQKIDGIPFELLSVVNFGDRYASAKSIQLSITRIGESTNITVPLVPAGHLYPERIIFVSLAVLLLELTSFFIYWRFHHNPEIRVLYLIAQTAGIGLILPAAQLTQWNTLPAWQVNIGGMVVSFSILLSYYMVMTFPVKVGSLKRRRIGTTVLCLLGLIMAVWWLMDIHGSGSLINKFIIASLLGVVFLGAIVQLLRSYQQNAALLKRRQLRLVVLGFLFTIGPSSFLFSIPKILLNDAYIPPWLAGLTVLTGLSIYVFVTLKQNINQIDRFVNRAIVYLFLFTIILILLVIPVLLLNQILPGDWIVNAFILSGVTLLVAFSYAFIRQWVQRRVDIFFYGGWYDYPKVIDTISAALAHSLKWEQLKEILTRQVPELMNLTAARLAKLDEPFEEGIHLIQIPLRFEDKPYATWLIGPRRDSDEFSTSDRNIFATLTPQIEVAMSNILHIEKLREQLEDIRASEKVTIKMGQQLIRSRDQEQERLSRELHDGPLQALVGMNMQLGLMLSKTGAETVHSPVGETLSGLQGEVRSLMTELREVCTGLRPPMLDTLGLSSALRALVEKWASDEQIPVQLELPPDDSLSFLTSEVSLNLFRVVQEGLTNIARHAGASQVSVCLTCDPLSEMFTLTIQDNGKGFIPKEVFSQAGQNHFGLTGMQERVRLIGGYWTLSSAPGCGTTIRVTRQVPDWQNSGEVDSKTTGSVAG